MDTQHEQKKTKRIRKCCKSCQHLYQINIGTNIMHRCKDTGELINNVNNNASCKFYLKIEEIMSNE